MASLKNISNAELILRIEKLVRSERKITHLILLSTLEIEDRKIYAEMGYDGIILICPVALATVKRPLTVGYSQLNF